MDVPSTSKKEAVPRVATRQSSRRIVKKTRPDYIEDFSRAASTDEEPKPSPKLKQLFSTRAAATKKKAPAKKRVRVRVRAKRHVKVDEPTAASPYLPTSDSTRIAAVEPRPEKQNFEGLFDNTDDTLTCKFCQIIYPNTWQYRIPVYMEYLRHKGFVCPKCKKCEVCQKAVKGEEDKIFLCSRCSVGYHGSCHAPPLDSDEESGEYFYMHQWLCGKCEPRDAVENSVEKAVSAEGNGDKPAGLVSLENLSTAVINGDDSQGPRMHLSVQREEPAGKVVEGVPGQGWHNSLTNGLTNGSTDLEDVSQGPSKQWTTFFPPTADTDDESPSSPEAKALRQKLARWSPKQCAEVFAQSYPELAELIVKHGLFGSSLMILSRAQFMDLFELKVGTALKMHYAISQWRRAFF
ncbi:hypothetical protein RvY_18803 [Ramazzottius varieornatus]|uniref:PHD-type domain-containing protein n=1 Tax=Ramazzottius varieornatus TaxID=947166 RepID=A0A1D1WBS8_RAMVA|nr:hypothetical protein RvY_18803 [Ramazzottius varieornatus]